MTSSRHLGTTLALCVAIAGLGACDKDDGDDGDSGTPNDDGGSTGGDDDGMPAEGSTGGTGPDQWVVGAEGEMLRLDADGKVDRYPLDVTQDFFAIACRGELEAWVVGASGTLLVTHDAGDTWEPIALDTTADLRAVAAADDGPIWVIGDGVAFVSHDDGHAFHPADVPAHAFTAVAVEGHGAYGLIADADGTLWRIDADDVITTVASHDAALRGLSIAGEIAVAVGDVGTMLRSEDAGESFAPVALATSADLQAVQVVDHGEVAVAVGSAGTIARTDTLAGTTILTPLDPALTLRGIHMVEGHGHALGDAGALLETFDVGETWSPVALPTSRTLYGIDHPGALHE